MRFDETTEADDRARRIAEAERLVVGLAADDQRPALLDLFKRLRRGRRCGNREADGGRGRAQKQFFHADPLDLLS
jgi:hypothetical protein